MTGEDATDGQRAEAGVAVDFSQLFDISSALFCVASTDGYFLELNRAWETTLGYPLKELRGVRFLDFVHPDDVEATAAVMADLLDSADVVGFVNRYLAADGQYRHIEWRASPRGGLIYATANDVTEQVLASERLRSSEELHRTLFEVTSQGIVYHDAQGRIVGANPAAQVALGLTFEQLSGRTPLDPRWRAIREDGSDFPGSEHPAAVALATGEEVTNVLMGIFHPGSESYRWLRVNALPIHDPGQSRPRMVNATFDDVTEARRTELLISSHNEALRRAIAEETAARARLDNLLATLDRHAIVSMTDLDGRITYINDNFRMITGYSDAEVLGRTHKLINSGHHPFEFFTQMWDTITAGQTWHGEICNRAKDGRIYWVLSTIAPFRDPDGIITQYVSIRTDITAQKSAELAAEAANDAKSRFLATMSHEIRTPLTSIIGLSHVTDRPGLDPQVSSALSQIRTSGEHLLAMLNDILDFAKIESQQVELRSEPMSVAEAIDQVVGMYREPARAKGLRLDAEIGEAVPAALQGDSLRLRQVLLNLVSNAVKCTLSGSVRIHATSLPARPDGSVPIRFAVADTGPGISAADAGRIFDPFVQADASLTRTVTGTGLGLAISSQLVELMGGTLEVDSTPGEGSRFSFTLPFQRANTGEVYRAEDRPTPAKRLSGHVLLVEDNEVNRTIAEQMLLRLGLTVDLAADGGEAVALCRDPERHYSVILMDIHMPTMDGWEATRLIRGIPATAQVPIIALTANALTGDRQASLEAGMNDHLAKPFRPADLAAVLTTWLPGSRRILDLGVALRSAAGDPTLMVRLFAIFRTDLATKIDSLGAADAAGNRGDLRHLAHSLKGSAKAMGATALATECAQLEDIADSSSDISAEVAAVITLAEQTDHQVEVIRASMVAQLGDGPAEASPGEAIP